MGSTTSYRGNVFVYSNPRYKSTLHSLFPLGLRYLADMRATRAHGRAGEGEDARRRNPGKKQRTTPAGEGEVERVCAELGGRGR